MPFEFFRYLEFDYSKKIRGGDRKQLPKRQKLTGDTNAGDYKQLIFLKCLIHFT